MPDMNSTATEQNAGPYWRQPSPKPYVCASCWKGNHFRCWGLNGFPCECRPEHPGRAFNQKREWRAA